MKYTDLTEELYNYLFDTSVREHSVLKALREETLTHELAVMLASPEQAQFLQFLLKMMNGKKVLEVGTFTGYTSLALALGLPEDGEVITCDINSEWTKNTHSYWKQANQDHKINLRLGPALETMEDLLQNGYKNQFDLIFIDADKTNYINYYELALKLIKNTGVIAIDNVLWSGRVLDKSDESAQTREIRKLNNLIKNDDRVDISLLPIADGLFLVKLK